MVNNHNITLTCDNKLLSLLSAGDQERGYISASAYYKPQDKYMFKSKTSSIQKEYDSFLNDMGSIKQQSTINGIIFCIERLVESNSELRNDIHELYTIIVKMEKSINALKVE